MIGLPLRYAGTPESLKGIKWSDLDQSVDVVRQLELASIRMYVEEFRGYLWGRVLDFGAGRDGTCRKPQPYRDLVKDEYVAYEPGDPTPQGTFNAVLMTQVIQRVEDPVSTLQYLRRMLNPGGVLVMTGPTSWTEVDNELWRFTELGVRKIMEKAGYQVRDLTKRVVVDFNGFELSLGWGVVGAK